MEGIGCFKDNTVPCVYGRNGVFQRHHCIMCLWREWGVLRITLYHVSMEGVLRMPLSRVSIGGEIRCFKKNIVSCVYGGCFKDTIVWCVYWRGGG